MKAINSYLQTIFLTMIRHELNKILEIPTFKQIPDKKYPFYSKKNTKRLSLDKYSDNQETTTFFLLVLAGSIKAIGEIL